MRYTREYLLKFLETLRDEMMTTMNPFERAQWIAERSYSITGVILQAREEEKEEEKKRKRKLSEFVY